MAQGSDPSSSSNVMRRLLDTSSRVVTSQHQEEAEPYPRLRPPSLPWSGNVTGAYSRPPRMPVHVAMMRKFKSEAARFRTFFNWKNQAVRPSQLAKAGFFYFNDEDKVQCVFCLGILGNWKAGEDPAHEHRTHFPRCPFMLGDRVGNIPNRDLRLTSNGRALEQSSSPPSPVIGNPLFQNYICVRKDSPTVFIDPSYQLIELNIELYIQPKRPELILLNERLETFKTWPIGLTQTPLSLAQAGFYYTNVGDRVKCYHCDTGLINWLPGDCPWSLHARWGPHCIHLLLIKGQQYINAHSVTKAQRIVEGTISNVPEDLIDIAMSDPCEAVPDPDPEESPEDEGSTNPTDSTCSICLTKPANVVILPCAHLVACGECIAQLRGTCPVCRLHMKGFVKVFRS